MIYIFLDESGDLGFNFKKKKTSNFFIITFLLVLDTKKKSLEKMVKKIFKKFTKKEIEKHYGTLHCYKERPKIRCQLLQLFNDTKNSEVLVLCIILNKKRVYTDLKNQASILYNYVTNILLDRLSRNNYFNSSKQNIKLIASQRETNKFLNQNFKKYLEFQSVNNHKLNLNIEIRKPKQEKCLQIVDFLSWSIFRKYEHQEEKYYNFFKEKIIEENYLFGK